MDIDFPIVWVFLGGFFWGGGGGGFGGGWFSFTYETAM